MIKHSNLTMMEAHHNIMLMNGFDRVSNVEANFFSAWCWYKQRIKPLVRIFEIQDCKLTYVNGSLIVVEGDFSSHLGWVKLKNGTVINPEAKLGDDNVFPVNGAIEIKQL